MRPARFESCLRHATRPLRRIMAHLFITCVSFSLPFTSDFTQAAEHLQTTVMPGIGIHEVTRGTLLFKTAQPDTLVPAPTLKTDVQIAVTGIIGRTTVRQEFTNPSRDKDHWAEAIYVFPLPETAAVDHLRMTVGNRTIEGQIKERTEAKKVYDQAKQQGKRTSLLEQERPNIFTTSVANVGPGERITVEIEYQETLRYESGEFQLRFPMVVGPRYIPGTPVIVEDEQPKGSGTRLDTDRVSDASRITPPVVPPGARQINPVSLSLTLHAGFHVAKIDSPSHPILVIHDPEGREHITLREDAVSADRDFQLTWQPASGVDPTATLLTEQQEGETYALLMLMPPTRHNEKMPRIPRDVTFIIDTSGSMAGASIEQARVSVGLALSRLTTHDRFNLIQFNDHVRSLFSDLQPVTADTIKKALRYADHLVADGSTEMLPALRQALKSPIDPNRLQQIVLLTDGQIGNEEELFELLQHRLGGRRVFTVGIGSAPNSHLMRKTAEFGRGTFTYIGKISDVKEKMDALFNKLERPVLSDLRFDQTGSGIEYYPGHIPDLYEGEPLLLAIKTRTLPEQTVLQGKVGTIPWSLPVTMKPATVRSGLSVYWARQKISALVDEAVAGRVEDQNRKAILDVALAHHLVSKYTSLVAVDVTASRPIEKPLIDQALASHLPHGQEYTAIFGLPQTGTSAPMHLVLGAAILTLWGTLWRLKSRCA